MRDPVIPIDQGNFIFVRTHEINQAMNKDNILTGGDKHLKQEIYIRWEYPRAGWVRLNTDGPWGFKGQSRLGWSRGHHSGK